MGETELFYIHSLHSIFRMLCCKHMPHKDFYSVEFHHVLWSICRGWQGYQIKLCVNNVNSVGSMFAYCELLMIGDTIGIILRKGFESAKCGRTDSTGERQCNCDSSLHTPQWKRCIFDLLGSSIPRVVKKPFHFHPRKLKTKFIDILN